MEPDRLAAVAGRHGLSLPAVRALADALARRPSGGAQWNHPDLGGMGQWLGGGMLQIGAMFDADLKRRVAGALEELASLAPTAERSRPPSTGWWPAGLGTPSATGAQNATRYACFPAARRVAVERDGRVTVHDTGALRLTGVSQAQGDGAQTIVFSGPDGALPLEILPVV